LIQETADSLVDDGFLSAGYEYLIIDDCWLAKQRDADGRLAPDPHRSAFCHYLGMLQLVHAPDSDDALSAWSCRFPSGIPALVDYVHARWEHTLMQLRMRMSMYWPYKVSPLAGA
jgi:hypothetical protein